MRGPARKDRTDGSRTLLETAVAGAVRLVGMEVQGALMQAGGERRQLEQRRRLGRPLALPLLLQTPRVTCQNNMRRSL